MHFQYSKTSGARKLRRHLLLYQNIPAPVLEIAGSLLRTGELGTESSVQSQVQNLFNIPFPKGKFHFQSLPGSSQTYLSFDRDAETWFEQEKGKPLFNPLALQTYAETLEKALARSESSARKDKAEDILPSDNSSGSAGDSKETGTTAPAKKGPKPVKLDAIKLLGRWADLKHPVQIENFSSHLEEKLSNLDLGLLASTKAPLDWESLSELTGIEQQSLMDALSIALGEERLKTMDPLNEVEWRKTDPEDSSAGEWSRESHLEYGSTIVIFNLKGSAYLELLSEYGGKYKSILMKENSCIIIDDSLRWAWKRKIIPARTSGSSGQSEPNYTLILRHRRREEDVHDADTLKDACVCTFDETICEIKKKIHEQRLQKMSPQELEDLYVRDVYDAIAEHWDSTRNAPWKPTVDFLLELPEGSYVADVGCGNGRNMIVNNKLRMEGCDISSRLVDICKQKGLNAVVGDAKKTPFADNQFDHAISVAVLHHFSTEETRLQAMKELYRIVKPNGLIFLYAWAFEQDETSRREFNTTTQDVMVPWNLQKKFIEMREKNLKEDDEVSKRVHSTFGTETIGDGEDAEESKVPDRIVYQRYCYLFKEGELERLWFTLFDESQIEIVKVLYDCGNWCTIVRKLK